jgi:WD40 repeat protein
MEASDAPLRVFCSFAPEDADLCHQLHGHLRPFEREGTLTLWHQRLITAGTDWTKAIDEHLASASIIVLLVSPAFFASDYCYGVEMQQALQRHETGDACVIPILVRSVNWQSAPFAKLAPLPSNGKFVTQWENHDVAFTEIAEGIHQIVSEITRPPATHVSKKESKNHTTATMNTPLNSVRKKLSRRDLIFLGLGTGFGSLLSWALLEGPRAVNTLICNGTTFVYRHHTKVVETVAWSPSGSRIASGSWDGTVQVWDATTGNNMHMQPHGDEVRAVVWSPDGKYLASGSYDRNVRIWNPITDQMIHMYLHQDKVTTVAWSPDGKYLASGDRSGTIQIWEIATQTLKATYSEKHTAAVRSVAWSPFSKWSPQGTLLASGGEDGLVFVWDALTNHPVFTYQGHLTESASKFAAVFVVAWSPDGLSIASGSLDTTVHVWDSTGDSSDYIYRGHVGDVEAVAWSPDGKRIASGSGDRTVQVWDATVGGNVTTFSRHHQEIEAVAWSPDGSRIVSGSRDNTVQVWSSSQSC